MNVFDIIIIALLIFAFIRGIFKGFVMGLSGFIGIISSIYIAKYFSAPVIRLAESLLGIDQKISSAVGFIIVFLAALLLFHFIAVLVDKLISLIALGWLNKLLGGVLFLLKYLFIISVFFNIFDAANKNLDIVSQKTYICTASHDITHSLHPLITAPIIIEDQAWIAADAFIGMGVTIGQGSVVGARSSVFKDVEAWTVVGGNPAKFIKRRQLKE